MVRSVKQVCMVFGAGICLFFALACNRTPLADYNNVLVTRVFDGDTFEIETGQRIRIIGIDCPESYESDKLYRQAEQMHKDIRVIIAMGKQAWSFTSKLIAGKRVRLEFDAEHYDKYGRLLAYVYLPSGTFVNAEIVKEGYASLLNIPPNVKYAGMFRLLYKQAREENRGLWVNGR